VAHAQGHARAPQGVDQGLTGAVERDICVLVAGGASNREVAAALYLPTRTVEHHLRMAYRKLGIRSRAGLAGHFGSPG
jgi:DNA-binding CsgD family transcriptional regulator